MTEPAPDILAFAHALADAAGNTILPHFRRALPIDDKTGDTAGVYDPVTVADRAAETTMRKLIEARYPRHAIFGEEHGRSGEGPETWILDPIDGTRSFIGGFPTWGTLIGYSDGEELTVGIMDQAYTRERWVASPAGAFFGDRILQTRSCGSVSDAVLYCTAPEMFEGAEREAFASLERDVKLRRFGGDCYAYAMLAMGMVDLVVEARLKPYDVAALIPIVQRSGGVMTTWDGGKPNDGGRIVAAGDPARHAEVVRRLSDVT